MSQFFQGVTASSLPPSVAEEFDTQSGNAVPSAHVILFNAYDSSENNDNGIVTKGGTASGDPPGTGATNEMDVYLTNRVTGTVTTADATITTIITFPLGATPGTYHVYGDVQAFNSSIPAGGAYSYSGGYRTDGATATELGIELHDEFEDSDLVTSEIYITTSGNNVLVQVQGVLATSINWSALLEYRRVF